MNICEIFLIGFLGKYCNEIKGEWPRIRPSLLFLEYFHLALVLMHEHP